MFRDLLLLERYKRSGNKAFVYSTLFFATFTGIYFLFSSFLNHKTPQLQNGDIIFQTSESSQCTAVRLATRSKYSHCGIIFMKGTAPYVLEAVGPVISTPFQQWIQGGTGGKYLVKRLKNAPEVLTPGVIKKMEEIAGTYKNKEYDLYFGWSDELIYCSELVWKIYKQGADLEVGKLQKLKDMDLSSAPVKQKLKERYGDNVPMEETVISPAGIAESDLLITVADTY